MPRFGEQVEGSTNDLLHRLSERLTARRRSSYPWVPSGTGTTLISPCALSSASSGVVSSSASESVRPSLGRASRLLRAASSRWTFSGRVDGVRSRPRVSSSEHSMTTGVAVGQERAGRSQALAACAVRGARPQPVRLTSADYRGKIIPPCRDDGPSSIPSLPLALWADRLRTRKARPARSRTSSSCGSARRSRQVRTRPLPPRKTSTLLNHRLLQERTLKCGRPLRETSERPGAASPGLGKWQPGRRPGDGQSSAPADRRAGCGCRSS